MRATEDEADRLSVCRLVNAGYDGGLAARVWQTAGAALESPFRSRTHGAAAERARGLAAEAAILAATPGRSIRPVSLDRRDVSLH